jgi:tetratricopeptide (TPR) repeat protein
LDPDDPRLLYERDVLHEIGRTSAEERYQFLSARHDVVSRRNDSLSREVILLVQTGRYDRAIEILRSHHFRRWEGVANVHGALVDAHLLRGMDHQKAGRTKDAMADFEAALEYPENLETARPYHGGREPQIFYLMGDYGKAVAARQENLWTLSRWYQALSLRKLGRETEAVAVLDGIAAHAKGILEAGPKEDFFAKFGSRRRDEIRKAGAHFLLGLVFLASGHDEEAAAMMDQALDLDPNHVWARTLRP